jgi:hypothetical protein
LTNLDGSSLCETVIESDEKDSIYLQLSEHSFPCSVLIAHYFSEEIDSKTSTYGVAFEYLLQKGTPDDVAEKFKAQIKDLGDMMVANVKDIFDTKSFKRFDLDFLEFNGLSKFYELTSFDTIIFICFCLLLIHFPALFFFDSPLPPGDFGPIPL